MRATGKAQDALKLTALTLVSWLVSAQTPGKAEDNSKVSGARSHFAYVACESEDEVAVVRLDHLADDTVRCEVFQRIRVGQYDVEIEGPHGLAVSPDGKYWYLSIAHGKPFGYVCKYETESNRLLEQVELGMFPASMQVSNATGLLHVVNFDLHGDHKPSSVSIVDPEEMVEVKRLTTGVMPHGSRFSPDGLKHYSLAMMSDELFEVDAVTLKPTRTLKLSKEPKRNADSKEHGAGKHHAMPTWVQVHPSRARAYVACNGSDEILEINLDRWAISRRIRTGAGPYNVEVTPDGKLLVVTCKKAKQTVLIDALTGMEVRRIQNSRTIPHGIAITPDSRFALVTVEGVGAEPGTVDVMDLVIGKRVASVDVGKQAGGIAYWKTVPLAP